MRTITHCTVISGSILALTVSPRAVTVFSGPLDGSDPALISADAAWVMHLDVEQALDTRLGRLLFDAGSARIALDAEKIEGQFGLHPMREIRRVTAYGLDAEGGPGVVIIEASSVLDRIIEELKTQH